MSFTYFQVTVEPVSDPKLQNNFIQYYQDTIDTDLAKIQMVRLDCRCSTFMRSVNHGYIMFN